MQVYKISPILKYSPFFELTYISKFDFSPGEIIKIDFNNRELNGIVMEKFSLKDAKVEIRKSSFKTKKIENVFGEEERRENAKRFPSWLFETLKKFSADFGISVGELYYYIFLENISPPAGGGARGGGSESQVAYFPDDLSYKIFKKQNKDLVCLKSSEIFLLLLAGKLSKITIKDFSFEKYINFQNPHISRLDLLFSILENSPVRDGGLELGLETDFLGVTEKYFLDKNVTRGKLFGKYKLNLLENNKKAKKYLAKVGRDKNGEEEILASEVLEKIENKKTFLFVLTHGYASSIFCNDCKKSYDCENCGSKFSLLKDEEDQFLFCKNCKNKKLLKLDQYVICKHCGSWRIFPYGVGGQKVLEFLTKNLPQKDLGDKIVLVDESENKLTAKKIGDLVGEFLENKNSHFLIGSIRTLKTLIDKKLDATVLVSAGPLIKGEFFDSDEKLMNLLSQLENISKELYINKHVGDEISLENYKDREKFLEQELKFRETAKLPPFVKVLTLNFNYRNKKNVDKFCAQDFAFTKSGEIKKGQNYIYYWFLLDGSKILETFKYLRNFGDIAVTNTIYSQGVLNSRSKF